MIIIKKIFVTVVIFISTAIFTFIGIWVAQYAVGLLQSNTTYNIILGIILAVLTIAFIALLCRKKVRIYSLLLFPHIIALSFIMLYIGNKINYIGDGFIKIESPFSKESKIKTVSGRVVFDDAWGVYLSSISGKTLFVKKDYGFGDDNRNIYDRDGVCILIRPSDDKWMAVTRDAICTGKDITQYGNEEHKIRIRVFNLSGEYMATRIYTGKISFGDYNWNQYSEGQEFLTEYIEEVVELEDGVKMFIQNDDYSQRSEEISMDDENIENVAKSSTPKIQPREQVRTGHWEYKECPTCYGYGEHNKVDCKYCLEAYRNGYNIKCLACGGSGQVSCPNHKIELKKYVYD